MSETTESARQVVIIGGNAAGAACATRLRRLDETVSIKIFEQGPVVSYATCGLPYYVGGVIPERSQLLVVTPAWLRDVFAIEVYTSHRVEKIDRSRKKLLVRNLTGGETLEVDYEALVLAPGSKPAIPQIPGIDLPQVFVLRTLTDAERLRRFVEERPIDRAAILGGGFIGIEMAENFLRRGFQVSLIERLPQLMPLMDAEMVSPLEEHLRSKGVDIHLETELVRIQTAAGEKLLLVCNDGSELTADILLVAAGARPDTDLAVACGLELGELGGIRVSDSMRTSDPAIWAVGDAVEVRHWVTGEWCLPMLAGPSARQGRVAAENIVGRPTRFRGCQLTHIVGFFELTLASTGATEKQLRRCGLAYRKSYTVSPHHATYYPGAERMTTKLLFEPTTGRLLGAQIVGGQGVDRRIDVLALAIQQRATVFDLEEGEFAYAPQFGSTRDPINIAGSAAANILRGDSAYAYWDEWWEMPEKDRPVVVDVRNPPERAQFAVPGTLFIPLPELRARLAELPRDREIWVHCAVGQRGYYASRILKQNGFAVKNLSGGITSFRMLPKKKQKH